MDTRTKSQIIQSIVSLEVKLSQLFSIPHQPLRANLEFPICASQYCEREWLELLDEEYTDC